MDDFCHLVKNVKTKKAVELFNSFFKYLENPLLCRNFAFV